eukprot:6027021-Pleurochrysis_carterae.AAC.1
MESLVAYRIAQTILRTRTSETEEKEKTYTERAQTERERKEGRQHACGGPMAALKRGRQATVGGSSPRPAAARFARRYARPPGEEEATTAERISGRCTLIDQ